MSDVNGLGRVQGNFRKVERPSLRRDRRQKKNEEDREKNSTAIQKVESGDGEEEENPHQVDVLDDEKVTSSKSKVTSSKSKGSTTEADGSNDADDSTDNEEADEEDRGHHIDTRA